MIPVNEPLLPGREAEYVQDCIATGWISSAGKYIDRFEREWAAYCGRRYGVAVCNGTVALELAVAALELPKGGEVILPSFTIVSCLEAVLRNALVPVLVDCDPLAYCLDVDDVLRKATERTVAVMPVHIYGHPADMGRLLPLCAERGWKVIEDAAEAHGASCLVDSEWHRCGSFGEVSCFSFYANKNITCGEGGMVLTNDPLLYERMCSKRTLCFGKKERFMHEDRGWNFRMTNLQAAIGCAQLENIDRFIGRKKEMALRYSAGLRGLPLQLPAEMEWAESTIWMYAVLLHNSAGLDAVEFARRLAQEKVQTRPFFKGMHEQKIYRSLGLFNGASCPVTENIYRNGLYLPSGQAITNDQIDQVIASVRKVLS